VESWSFVICQHGSVLIFPITLNLFFYRFFVEQERKPRLYNQSFFRNTIQLCYSAEPKKRLSFLWCHLPKGKSLILRSIPY